MKKKKLRIREERNIDLNLFYLSNQLNSLINSFVYNDKHIERALYDLLGYVDDKVYGPCPDECDLLDEKISIVTIYERVCN